MNFFRYSLTTFTAFCVANLTIPLTAQAATPSFRSGSTPLSSIQAKIESQKLYNKRAWKKALFYVPRWFGQENSIIDSPNFFLSPHGKTQPRQEMLAFAAALFETPTDKNQHVSCRFPGRTSTFLRWFPELFAQLPDCPDVDTFFQKIKAKSASLIFSSFYTNNPASLFGHTFLKLKRDTPNGLASSSLLDYAVNYSAFPDSRGPFAYVIKGFSGGFPGYFSVSPYYVKVSEYSQSESRDLWEYELNLKQEEVTHILKFIIDTDRKEAEYYFLDDNCSYMILALLNAVRPDLELTKDFPTWVLPTDTLRRVKDQENFVTDIRYRPSARKKFLHQLSQLTEQEKDTFFEAIHDNGLPQLPQDKAASVKILETIVEYVDYTGKIVQSDEESPLKKLRRESLGKRASLGTSDFTINDKVPVPYDEIPTKGHKTSALTVGHKHHDLHNINEYQLEWIPAMHLSNARSTGYSKNSDLKIFHIKGAFVEEQNKFRLRHFIPLGIQSLNTDPFPIFKPSWNLQIEVQSDCLQGCYWSGLQGGMGYSLDLFSHSLVLYGMGTLQAGYQDPSWDASPGLRAGFSVSETEAFNVKADTHSLYRSFLKRWEHKTKLMLTVSPLVNTDIVFSIDINKRDDFQRSYTTTLRMWY